MGNLVVKKLNILFNGNKTTLPEQEQCSDECVSEAQRDFSLKQVGNQWFLCQSNGKKSLLKFQDASLEGEMLQADGRLYDVDKNQKGEMECVEVVSESNGYYLKKRKTSWVLVSKEKRKHTVLSSLGKVDKVELQDDMLHADNKWYDINQNADGSATIDLVSAVHVLNAKDYEHESQYRMVRTLKRRIPKRFSLSRYESPSVSFHVY